MTDLPILPDWVLLEAAKRGGWATSTMDELRPAYACRDMFRALCDMIAKHEQKPVDRKLLCAWEALKMLGDNPAPRVGLYMTIELAKDVSVRAIELWEEGFGK